MDPPRVHLLNIRLTSEQDDTLKQISKSNGSRGNLSGVIRRMALDEVPRLAKDVEWLYQMFLEHSKELHISKLELDRFQEIVEHSQKIRKDFGYEDES